MQRTRLKSKTIYCVCVPDDASVSWQNPQFLNRGNSYVVRIWECPGALQLRPWWQRGLELSDRFCTSVEPPVLEPRRCSSQSMLKQMCSCQWNKTWGQKLHATLCYGLFGKTCPLTQLCLVQIKHVTWIKILYLIEGWNPFVTSCWDFLSQRWWSSLLECAGILYTVWSSECAGSYRKGSLFQFQLFPEKALLKLRVNVQKCKSLRSPVLVGTKNQVVPGLLQPQGSSRRSWSCSAIFTTTGGMQQIWATWQFLVALRTVQERQDFVQEVHATATSEMRHHWPGSRQAEIQFISANAAK